EALPAEEGLQRAEKRRRARRDVVEAAKDRRVTDLLVESDEGAGGEDEPEIPGADEDAESGEHSAAGGVDARQSRAHGDHARAVADGSADALDHGDDRQKDGG